MAANRLTPIDAQTFWLSAKIPNDTVLMFGFAGVPADLERALDEIEARAAGCPELGWRVHDGSRGYPRWVHRGVDRSQFVVHDLPGRTYEACLAAVGTLVERPLDATDTAWRLHVFADVLDVPGVDGPGVVAVLRISHALGGGGRTSAHAALLFGRSGVVLP